MFALSVIVCEIFMFWTSKMVSILIFDLQKVDQGYEQQRPQLRRLLVFIWTTRWWKWLIYLKPFSCDPPRHTLAHAHTQTHTMSHSHIHIHTHTLTVSHSHIHAQNNNNAGVFLLRRLPQHEGEWVINILWPKVAFTVYSERYWWWIGSLSYIGAMQTQVRNTCSD